MYLLTLEKGIEDSEKSTKIVREFKDDEMIQTSSVIGSDTVCKEVFKKQHCFKKSNTAPF